MNFKCKCYQIKRCRNINSNHFWKMSDTCDRFLSYRSCGLPALPRKDTFVDVFVGVKYKTPNQPKRRKTRQNHPQPAKSTHKYLKFLIQIFHNWSFNVNDFFSEVARFTRCLFLSAGWSLSFVRHFLLGTGCFLFVARCSFFSACR